MRFFLVLIALVGLHAASGQTVKDPTVDDLIKKLPPPEKLVKPPVTRAVEKAGETLTDKDPLVRQMLSLINARRYPDALKVARVVAQNHPRSEAAHGLHGALAFVLNQRTEALAAFRAATVAAPRSTFGYFFIAVIEADGNHFSAAIPPLQKLVEIDPHDYIGFYALSDCAHHVGRNQDALTYAKKATALAPASPFCWVQLALCERTLGHTDGTLTALTKAADVSPDTAPLLASVGYSYINLDRTAQAIGPLQRAARMMPGNYLAQSQLGYCYLINGQTNAAIDRLRKATSLKSDYGPGWEHLGLAYQKAGRHREAVNAFERASRLLPTSARPWQHLAQEYTAVGRSADAQNAANRARQLGGSTRSKR